MHLCPRIMELTATHNLTSVACISVRANSPFPIPVTHLTYEQLVGLVTRGLLVIARPAGKTPTIGETRCLPLYRLVVPDARNETGGRRRGKVLSSPRWPSSLPVRCLSLTTITTRRVRSKRARSKKGLPRSHERRMLMHSHCVSNNHPSSSCSSCSSSSSYSSSVRSSLPTMTLCTEL